MSIHNNASITRKRTRDEADEVSELDVRPFVIKDYSDPFARPKILIPICLLSRAQLPLAYLDTSTSGSRVFAASIPILESSLDHEDGTSVLIARDSTASRLSAIERVKRRCYALCRLGDWVTTSEVQARARVVLQDTESQVKRQALDSGDGGAPWWRSAAVDVSAMADNQDPRSPSLPMLAMRRVMEASQKVSVLAKTITDGELASDASGELLPPALSTVEYHISSQDVLKELSKQYLEALYLSRTSLAYFTKGPLSRARAAFTMAHSKNDIHELIQFLRDSMMMSSRMDKKYRDGIAGVVKEILVQTTRSPGKTPTEPIKKKRRKRKAKRDKHGFYAEEHEYIERWWHAADENESVAAPSDNMDEIIRRRVVRIRNRETFLQIIIVLEMLALEATNSPPTGDNAKATHSADLADQDADNHQTPENKKVKRKKKQDPTALLETLLDKLCIWQSLQSHSPSKMSTAADDEGSGSRSDELQNFCVEIVMPFFSSRIPQFASIVNKKLGGPTAPTPVKRKPSAGRKTGESAIRQPLEKKARQPLARVSTDSFNQSHISMPDRPPSLQRSVTDSETGLHIKREGSEVPMDSIPLARPTSLTHSRRSSTFNRETPQLKAFSKREVDLTAISASNEAKMRKKKDVEAKLKEAVEMLKKPNRALAVKEMEQRTDETFAKAMAKSKAGQKMTSVKPSTDTLGTTGGRRSVDVTSTPKHVRTVKATPHKPSGVSRATNSIAVAHLDASSSRFNEDEAFALPNSTPAIPQTGHRPRITPNVQQTPSRGFAKFMPAGLARQPGTLESPVSSRMQAMVQQTPSKVSVQHSTQPLVAGSPNVVRARQLVSEAEGEHGRGTGNDKSIYDALGWDDDGYEELA